MDPPAQLIPAEQEDDRSMTTPLLQSGYGPLFSMGCQIETDCLSVSIRLSSDPIRQADGEWISSDFGRCQRTLDTCLLTSATP